MLTKLIFLKTLYGDLVGNGGEKIFVETDNKVNTDFTTLNNNNYLGVLPLSIDATLTVSSGSSISFL
tara:strand:- start:3576 stop:3776 length:201 start_codon:yes stop_codon:yes gene_type:complete